MSKHRKQTQLRRLMLVIELLAPLRRGATLQELQQDVSECFDACKRTIRRDLQVLESMGFVECELENLHHGGRVQRWRWIGQSVRGVMFRHIAELQEVA